MTILSLKKNLTFFTALTGTVIGTMHVVNRIFQYISTADNILSDDKYDYYNWRFGKITYKKTGSGSPVLLIHDLNVCSSSYEFEKVCSKLSKINTVYSIDLLGCGRSDRPAFTYTNFLYVELITNFIKHIIGEKTDVIVSGESCPFVLMACANDDSIINKVVMINPPNLVKMAKIPTKASKLFKKLIFTPVIGTFIYNLNVNKKTILQKFIFSYYYAQNDIKERDILTYFESSHKDHTHSKYLYACQKSRYLNANIVHCLSRLTNSIYIIVGNSNPENILAANEYQNYLPSIEIKGIAKAKQMPHMEKPEEFFSDVKIFLSDAQ